jgi:hypothetical protein
MRYIVYLAIISFITALPISHNLEIPFITVNTEYADKWADNVIANAKPEETQLITNILYLLYANALIDAKARLFIIPITKLTQSIRSNIVQYKETTSELNTLKTLIDRLSYIMGARTIYNQQLQVCLEYCNKNMSPILNQAILELQEQGQTILNNYLTAIQPELGSHFDTSATILRTGCKPLQSLSEMYNWFTDGTFSTLLAKEDPSLIPLLSIATYGELLQNTLAATYHTEHLLNTLDVTTDSIVQLIGTASTIYKYYYGALYSRLLSDSYDEQYRYTLFGIADTLPEEFKSLLPHPDQVFNHILQTIKLYTKISLIQ